MHSVIHLPPLRWLWGILLLAAIGQARADLLLNEVLFNPPGLDTTNEFIELRGTPNMPIPEGTWLVFVEGDENGNPGTIQNVFDLSGRRVGQNGFLVLLQKFHRYPVNPLATVITNADNQGGWGNGSSSPFHHHGEDLQVEIENPSFTLFLIQTTNAPVIGDDIDANDDGTPGGAVFNGWTVLDAWGVLDGDGAGDIVYGRVNFRRDAAPGSGALVPPGSVVVPLPFTPAYIGRNGNTADAGPTNWAASANLLGKAPLWFLGSNSLALRVTNTFPSARARAALNHVGGPNFGAKALPAMLVKETAGNTTVSETGLRDSYTLNLAFAPSGAVTTRVDAAPPVQISTDGRTFTNSKTLVFTTTVAKRITVRVLDNKLVGPSPLRASITHTITGTRDPVRYPTDTIILPVTVNVLDNEAAVLSEVKVNPPGTNDGPFEYIELKGPPGLVATNLHVIAVNGDGASAGVAEFSVNLTGYAFGTNGLMVVAAAGSGYAFAPGTTVVLAPQLALTGGALNNGGVSILLVGSASPIVAGADLDAGDNGILEGLPDGAAIMDAIAWRNNGSDTIYGGIDLTQQGFTPDAATRLPGRFTPLNAASWVVGDLWGSTGAGGEFDSLNVSSNVPPGTILTPGIVNLTAPRGPALTPLSHVIGDPDNPTVTFTVTDVETPAASLAVWAVSSNPDVVPDQNLSLARVVGGTWRLTINPVGVGYATIIIRISDGTYIGRTDLLYAASAPGRPGTHWLTGISDASTAIPIDANWMLVGDDENQTLRIYNRLHSGGPVKKFNLNTALQLRDLYMTNGPPGQPKEVDIEGSTRVGNRLFWIGSHSHAGDATERTNRARLFATDMIGGGTNVSLAFLGHYDFFKLDVLDWDARGLHGKGADYYGLSGSAAIGIDPKAADGSGFNIEGLCMAPGSVTTAYVSFRAPLVPPDDRMLALILPVTNFTSLAVRGGAPGSARFGRPIELNLGGRGIRSIEGNGSNYLIVAGPPGSGTNNVGFRLFTWNGQPDSAPVERAADLTGLNIEGIVGVPPGDWTPETTFQLLSDNGSFIYYGDDTTAKRLPIREFKKFRADTVALGGVLAARPQMRALRLTAVDETHVTWLAQPGTTYRLQCNTNFTPDGWCDLPGDVIATGPTATKLLPALKGKLPGQCFYRVRVVE
jgi:hypothetical protein